MNGDGPPPSVHRARTNGTFLLPYHGQPVCLLGTIIKADGGGLAFQVRASDGQVITVRIKDKDKPVTGPLSGLVEVYGVGQGRNLILADSFIIIHDAIAANFDMNAYNETLNLLQQNNDRHWLPEPQDKSNK